MLGNITRVINRFQIIFIPISIIFIISVLLGFAEISYAQRKPNINHPLMPLTQQEIKTTVSVIKKERKLTEMAVFSMITLQEPDKNEVLNFTPNNSFQRQAFAIVYERGQNKTYEGLVNLKNKTLSSWKDIPNVQPAIVYSEYKQADKVVKSDPRWQLAMRRRGITDFKQVMISCWAPGILNEAEEKAGNRICRALSYYKGKNFNFYARPIEGVVANINLNTNKVESFVEREKIPFSQENWDYDIKSLGKLRQAPKLLKIQQPNGKTFKIKGNEISWQGWKFRYLMHPRDGLVLYVVSYNDGVKNRPVLYRGSLSEMVVPYGHPEATWSFRNAFDVGEYNLGLLATTMELGKEIPENGVLLDAVFASDTGEPYVMPGVIGIYERDNGILWKHYEYNSKRNDVRRNRSLVITITAAVDNYDYGISWIFHQDGTLEVQNDLTGIVLVQGTTAEKNNNDNPFGQLMAKNIFGVNHQHIFNFRLDMDVDGQMNDVMEMNVKALPMDDKNPLGNAFVVENTPLQKETAAVRDMETKSSREWMVMSADKKNALGAATGYMLMPKTNVAFLPTEGAKIRERAKFATHHFWVTKYKPEELHAGGEYPNQTKPGNGLAEYIADDESLINEDIVLWYTLGVTHVPRPEDWPVMPSHRAGFKLVPRGFFTRNPAINLP